MKTGIIVAKCPKCKKELTKPLKSWIYGVFKVDAFSCNCGTNFREYTAIHAILKKTPENILKLEKHSFTLELQKGRWVKTRLSTGKNHATGEYQAAKKIGAMTK
jgi:hypothetical protein